MYPILPTETLIEAKTCWHCQASFPITDKDLEFYEKVSPVFNGKKYSIPTPTLCPDCRQQRRQSFKNIYHLYKNEEEGFISAISPDKWYNVISQKEWWENDGLWLRSWKDFDFSRSFFEQFHELQKVAPRWNLIQVWCENCDWCINMANSSDCYLVKSGWGSKDCYYGERVFNSDNVVDGVRVEQSNHCYSVLNVENCYKTHFSRNTKNAKESLYLDDCANVSHCIGCVWLRHVEYCILNKSVSKEEYFACKEKILSSCEFRKDFTKRFSDLISHHPAKAVQLEASENCFGDEIFHSDNAFYCFDFRDGKNAKYAFDQKNSNDLLDVNGLDDSNFCYESSSNFQLNSSAFCFNVASLSNCYYCETSVDLRYCFGCVGLNRKSYCIFNKQYTKEEYEVFAPKIIAYMQKIGEWGEFFPSSISPYGYNESEAQEYYPLTRDQISEGRDRNGKNIFNWSDYEPPFPRVEKIIPADKLPDDITKIPDDILNWAIECEVTKKPFRIIKQELEFYRKHNLPIPRRHPDQRHLDRMTLRNPRKLFERKCDKCGKDMITTYSPDRKEVVYCEGCYNAEVIG